MNDWHEARARKAGAEVLVFRSMGEVQNSDLTPLERQEAIRPLHFSGIAKIARLFGVGSGRDLNGFVANLAIIEGCGMLTTDDMKRH